jgi:transposase
MKEVEPIPWKGVITTEQRQQFLDDYQLNHSSIAELAERFCISSKTTDTWIKLFKKNSHSGFHVPSRKSGEERINEYRHWGFY